MSYDEIIAYFRKKLSSFPDGRIDYHSSKIKFVLNIWISYKGKLLLLKRSNKIGAYKEKRDCIWWHIDEEKPLEQKVCEEIEEELAISPDNIQKIHKGEMHIMHDQQLDVQWINYPVIVTLKKAPKIQLDRENSEYQRVLPEEIKNFDTLPELEKSYQYAQK